MKRDSLDQAALNTRVDIEGGGLLQRTVLPVEDGVDLRQRDSLHRDRDLNEVAGLRSEVWDTLELAHLPEGVPSSYLRRAR